jgi:hypothetical protein
VGNLIELQNKIHVLALKSSFICKRAGFCDLTIWFVMGLREHSKEYILFEQEVDGTTSTSIIDVSS